MKIRFRVGAPRLTGACGLLLALFSFPRDAGAGQATIIASQDNSIYSDSPDYSNGAGVSIFAGENSFGGIRRALLRFDVASHIPAGATITSVELTLNLSQSGSGTVVNDVHRLLSSWGEGASDAPGPEGLGTQALANDATWNDRFFGASLPWSNAGGDFHATPSTSLAIGGVTTWTFPSTPQIVHDAQDMLDHPATDFGWIVRGGETVSGTAKRFDSRQGPDSATWPRIAVAYTLSCAAPAAYCTAAPNSVGGSGAQMGWGGSQSIAANAFTLRVSGLPASTSGLFFFGPGTAAVPFGDGTRCVSPPFRRLATQAAVLGVAQRTLDFTTALASDITAGSTWYFQFFYRDTIARGAGFNLSNGLSAPFCP